MTVAYTAEISPPPLWLALAELPRALVELVTLPFTAPMLAGAPRGDGHAVLVLPGFVSSDVSTSMLRLFLRSLGYDAQPWELGRNLGWKSIGRESEKLAARLQILRARTGGKVSLIGWSLGGVMARQLAQKLPDDVRQVITLGAPFTGNARASSIAKLYEHVAGELVDGDFMKRILAECRAPLRVPTTAIYSYGDGIVAWRNCIERSGQRTENIAVRGSHSGLTINPAALFAIADRLAMRDGSWHPFAPTGWRASAYPTPA